MNPIAPVLVKDRFRPRLTDGCDKWWNPMADYRMIMTRLVQQRPYWQIEAGAAENLVVRVLNRFTVASFERIGNAE